MENKPDTPPRYEPIRVETHRDLRKNTRVISQRFNDDPELARLLMVNPILAFEDAGVQMTQEIKDHIMNRMRFPPKLVERIKRLESDIGSELKALGVETALPLSADQRERLLFDVLKLPREGDANAQRRRLLQSRDYRARHPLAAKLAEYERARQGALIFYPREVYEAYKSGQRRHHWLKSIRFKI